MNRVGYVVLLGICCTLAACAHKNSFKKAKIVLEDGLTKEIIKEGAGATPTKGQRVKVHYTGWLSENGKKGRKFDSSIDRGQPFQFIVGIGQVIGGWDLGIMSMKVGEKATLTIEPDLGYGARGAENVIPPYATLIFDVELLGIG